VRGRQRLAHLASDLGDPPWAQQALSAQPPGQALAFHVLRDQVMQVAVGAAVERLGDPRRYVIFYVFLPIWYGGQAALSRSFA
jgi:hypothetical protein